MDATGPDTEAADRAVAILSEHFECVQVFASRIDPTTGETINVSPGTGNWFARRGQVQDWLVKENEDTREKVRLETDRGEEED